LAIMEVNPLMTEVLRRGFKRGNQSGGLKDRGGISMLEAERHGVARCGGNRRRNN
jgi:hypothetical protein